MSGQEVKIVFGMYSNPASAKKILIVLKSNTLQRENNMLSPE